MDRHDNWYKTGTDHTKVKPAECDSTGTEETNDSNLLGMGTPIECSCDQCQTMCKYTPCSPTPKDVQVLIKNGHANRLAITRFEIEDPTTDSGWRTVKAIMPAIEGCHSGYNPLSGPCNFFKDGRCEIHTIKPTGGKLARHEWKQNGKNQEIHDKILKMWDSTIGELMVLWFEMEKQNEFRSKDHSCTA
jgi:hypothetical protein